MQRTVDPEILKYVANYELNLIEPATLGTEDLDKFQSSLRSVLGFIKYSNDSNALGTFLTDDEGLKRLDRDGAKVIRECTNTNITIDEREEVIDVCKAVQELNERARQKGIEEGKLEGIQEGRLEGIQKGRLETLRNSVMNVMESFHVTTEEAMNVLKVTTEDQVKLKGML